jgi:prepilin-type N-terminal cleavage/methylation domain-containing protein
MFNVSRQSSPSRQSSRAFTLVEVVVAMSIAALVFSGIILGFTTSSQRVEWASYNLAAQNLAQQGLEQARASGWDPQAPTPLDNCTQTNFPPVTTNILDVPITGTNNTTFATNTWTITDVGTSTYPLKMIRVDCSWRYQKVGGRAVVFTNTAVTLRAPNQ